MNEYQRFALEHPLNRADDWLTLGQLTREIPLPGGNTAVVVLAIDR